jgi:hypothetical protein
VGPSNTGVVEARCPAGEIGARFVDPGRSHTCTSACDDGWNGSPGGPSTRLCQSSRSHDGSSTCVRNPSRSQAGPSRPLDESTSSDDGPGTRVDGASRSHVGPGTGVDGASRSDGGSGTRVDGASRSHDGPGTSVDGTSRSLDDTTAFAVAGRTHRRQRADSSHLGSCSDPDLLLPNSSSRNSVETPVYWATPSRASKKYAVIKRDHDGTVASPS